MRAIQVEENLKTELDFIFTETPRKQINLFKLSNNFSEGEYQHMPEISKLSFFEFMEIVSYGYVSKQSKEDKLLQVYKKAKELVEESKNTENFYYVTGLKTAIKILGLGEE